LFKHSYLELKKQGVDVRWWIATKGRSLPVLGAVMAHANTDVLNSYQVNTLLEALLDLVKTG